MSLKKFLTHSGSALSSTLAVAAAVGMGAMLVSKTGELRGKADQSMIQNTIIENAMLDIKVHLANEANCSRAMDSNFDNLGAVSGDIEFTAGADLGGGVSIESITDQNPGERKRKILLVFRKAQKLRDNGEGVSSRRPDSFDIEIFERMDPANPSQPIRTCTSFENDGVDNSLEYLCTTVGGSYANGLCKPNYDKTYNGDSTPFTVEVDKLACEAVGGTLVGSECNGINIAGTIQSEHFRTNSITLGGVERIQTIDFSCPVGQIAEGMNRNGELVCRDIVCPKPRGVNASTYLFRLVGDQYYCECQRDRGPELDCGSYFPDNIGDGLGCSDELVDDECGYNDQCIIRKKRNPRCLNPNPGCDQVGLDDCGDICARGPRSNTWRPSTANTCTDETLTQFNDCGGTRIASGTKDCGGGDGGGCCFDSREECETIGNPGVYGCDLVGGQYCSQHPDCTGPDDPPPPPTTDCTNPPGGDGEKRDTIGDLLYLNQDQGECCLQKAPDGTCNEPGDTLAVCRGGNWEPECVPGECDASVWLPAPESKTCNETFTQTNCLGETRQARGLMGCCTNGDTRVEASGAHPDNKGRCCRIPFGGPAAVCEEFGEHQQVCVEGEWRFEQCLDDVPVCPDLSGRVCDGTTGSKNYRGTIVENCVDDGPLARCLSFCGTGPTLPAGCPNNWSCRANTTGPGISTCDGGIFGI